MSYGELCRGRYSASNPAYLVTAVAAGRQALFADFRRARLVIREMRRLHDEGLVTSLAWVLMPDHLHWLFVPRQTALDETMQLLKGRSAYAIRRGTRHAGTVWQPCHHDQAIRAGEDLLPIARKLAASPLRAGLVTTLGDYPHWDAVWLEPRFPAAASCTSQPRPGHA